MKFSKLIKRGGDAVLEGRGERIIKSAKMAQETLVRNLEQELMTLEDKRDIMLDHSPDNRYSLNIGKTFEADKWCKDYQDISVEIANKKIELEIAKSNLTDLFGKEGE